MGEATRGHVLAPDPNRRLATDLTTVWTRRDGVVALVPTIDCGDRTAVIEVTVDQHGPGILASLERKLVESFGTPTRGGNDARRYAHDDDNDRNRSPSVSRSRRRGGRPHRGYVGNDTSPHRHQPSDTSASIQPYPEYLGLAAKLTGAVIIEEVSP